MEKLAWIARITGFEDIPKAETVCLGVIDGGWKTIVKKNDFKLNDQVIYFRVGSILPATIPEAASLKEKPLKTKKILGVISQGLVLPLNCLKNEEWIDGEDVTSILGVIKHIEPEEKEVYTLTKGKTSYPDFFPKTEEKRVQGCKKELMMFEGPYIITQKYEGKSASFFRRPNTNKISPCSRNFELIKNKGDSVDFYNIVKHIDPQKFPDNIVIQGELIGPKISYNRHKVTSNKFYVFNVYDVENKRYLLWDDVVSVAKLFNFDTVPVVERGVMPEADVDNLSPKLFQINHPYREISNLLSLADEQRYQPCGELCEGVVIKSDHYGSDFHAKVISPNYEIKHK